MAMVLPRNVINVLYRKCQFYLTRRRGFSMRYLQRLSDLSRLGFQSRDFALDSPET